MKKKISKQKYEIWENLLRDIPVSVNNYFGDPTLQWDDTVQKLEDLLAMRHTGPVGIITKGKLSERHSNDLKRFTDQGLKVVVLVSISELPQFERIGMEHRYENIALLNKFGVRNIAYIRPLIPPYNTSKEQIDLIFQKLNAVGAKVVVASGFRGDDDLIAQMSPDETQEWTLRVKLMSGEVYRFLKEDAKQYGMKLFTRTACAVSYLTGGKASYNPYYNSPNLVHCEELGCPMRETCKGELAPKPGSMELVKFLGYDVQVVEGEYSEKCRVKSDERTSCPSCCTTCFILKTPRILVKGDINLADLGLVRFLTGMLAMQPGIHDDEKKDIGNIKLPNFPRVKGAQCLNSWWPYAHIGEKCFGCKYCIEKYYGSSRQNFGFPPALLLKKMNLAKED